MMASRLATPHKISLSLPSVDNELARLNDYLPPLPLQRGADILAQPRDAVRAVVSHTRDDNQGFLPSSGSLALPQPLPPLARPLQGDTDAVANLHAVEVDLGLVAQGRHPSIRRFALGLPRAPDLLLALLGVEAGHLPECGI